MKFFVLALGIGLSVTACGPPSPWTELSSVDELKDAFNRDRGQTRLVLIFSPT